MSHPPLPPLRCESRRPTPPDGGRLKWALALVVISASTLDALWLIPAQRGVERRRRELAAEHLRDLRAWRCAELAPSESPRRAPPVPRATRANDILLMAAPAR